MVGRGHPPRIVLALAIVLAEENGPGGIERRRRLRASSPLRCGTLSPTDGMVTDRLSGTMIKREAVLPERAVELYLDHRHGELAEATLKAHEYRLSRFVRWCEQRHSRDRHTERASPSLLRVVMTSRRPPRSSRSPPNAAVGKGSGARNRVACRFVR